MNSRSIIGIILIFGLFYIWAMINGPTEEERAEAQRIQDSIAAAQEALQVDSAANAQVLNSNSSDSLLQGADTSKKVPEPQKIEQVKLENDEIEITFSSKGAQIKDVWLKKYQKSFVDTAHHSQRAPLHLMNKDNNKWGYLIPKSDGGFISTEQLVFSIIESSSNRLRLKAPLEGKGSIILEYVLYEEGYQLDKTVRFEGLNNIIPTDETVKMHWVNQLNKLERGTYESTYSTLQYKLTDDNPTQLSWTGNDEEKFDTPIEWISSSNQFFSSILIPEKPFKKGLLQVNLPLEEKVNLLKTTTTSVALNLENQQAKLHLYFGPNDFEKLKSMGHELQDIVPYGWSIFGTINRWIVRPTFNFLQSFIGNLGISIIILTLFIKLILYPLTYRMLHSQAKMAALKPEIAKLKEKNKDDQQAQQMETMKLYREFGVNPLGGCMPMVLQMPIWFALYRFFPASLDFRQASFLWADDLSSYDIFMELPFSIPFYGDHISLFTLLWAISLFIYTYYNMRNMDNSMMQGNPMMKYMQYLMPVMFLFFLNSYASGLTCYLLFSNIINITQTLGTKKFIFNEEKIKEELNRNKEKPKKKSKFQERLQQAMEEQRKIQERKKKK